MIKQDHILRFEKFSQFPELLHGFSTRFFGSMRPSQDQDKIAVKKFATALTIDPQNIVRMNQIHSDNVVWVSQNDRDQTISDTDGLITKDKDIFLGVITADCLPVFFFDQKKNLVANVHAGWRGLYAEIIKVALAKMIKAGSNPSDIIVGIGPAIRVCCYEVSAEFVDKFAEKFTEVENYVIKRDGKLFFDMQLFAKEQLHTVGIETKNIEDANFCTKMHEDVYSCRREGEHFGEMMGIIGLTK